MKRLSRKFFDRDCERLARGLLGKVLCRELGGEVLRGRIVETEMYPGQTDEASHSFNMKKTGRNGAMFMAPGTAYVYNIYGMYCCFNISSKGDLDRYERHQFTCLLNSVSFTETGGCVLIRALEPLEGAKSMEERRSVKRKKQSKLKLTDLCSGPSKLCLAFGITKSSANEMDLTAAESDMWLTDAPEVAASDIVTSTRVGIEGAGPESAGKPFRFYERDNGHVSVLDAADRKRRREELREKRLAKKAKKIAGD